MTPIPQAAGTNAGTASNADRHAPGRHLMRPALRTDYSPEPYYSSYAVAPTTPVYGSTYNNYNYYPGYDSGSYAYYLPGVLLVPLLRLFILSQFGCYPFGLSFFIGSGFHSHFHFDHDRFFDRGRGFHNSGRFGSGVSVAGNFGSRGVTGGINFAAQTSPAFRGSVNNFSRSSFSGAHTFSNGPARAPAFYSEVQSALAERAVLAVRAALAARPAIHLGGGGFSHGGGGMAHGGGGHAGGHR